MKSLSLIVSILFYMAVCMTASCSLVGNTLATTLQDSKSDISLRTGPANQVCSGVNIHFVKGHEKDLDMIAAAGFKFIRMDFEWQSIERTKGVFDWTGYDELTANLEKRGLSAIYILDYSNSLYEQSTESKDPLTGQVKRDIASPQHQESIDAFAQWAAASARHYKAKNIIWEIWNEPNIFFWKPKPVVEQYTALAMATCKAVKAAVPEASIMGPASSEVPLQYLETFLASGILKYLDAVSVHPYRNYSKSPETAIADYTALRGLIERYAPAEKKQMPIISSEWGYSSSTKGVPLDKQQAYSVRMQLANILYGIPLSIWYDWKNDGEDPTEHEQNFGTVSAKLEPKPAYTAFQTMNRQMKSYTFFKRIDVKNENDFVLLFKTGDGSYRIAAWTTDQDHSVASNLVIQGTVAATAVSGDGSPLNVKTENGSLVINLKALPQYIKLPAGVQIK